MLVKLARWLRLFGASVKEVKYRNDKMILAYVRRHNTTLLTCDRMLYQMARKRRINCLLLPNTDIDNQLSHVFKTLGGVPSINTLRCTMCNNRIKPVSKNFAKMHNTPANALNLNNKFYYCNICKKIYWYGSHWATIRKRAQHIKQILSAEAIKGSPPLPRPH